MKKIIQVYKGYCKQSRAYFNFQLTKAVLLSFILAVIQTKKEATKIKCKNS